MAHEWPKKSKKIDTAVIVFKINCDMFMNRRECIFSEPTTAWAEVVKFFRCSKDTKKSNIEQKKAKEFRKYDFIFGPIADGGIYQRTFPPNPIKPLKYQLCLKNQDMADEIFNEGKNIEEVIFFCDS